MSEVKIRKPSDKRLEELNVDSWGVWEKEESSFDWYYSQPETFYVLEGKARVETPKDEVSFGVGDLVTFPEGMETTWHVIEPIKKKYTFESIESE